MMVDNTSINQSPVETKALRFHGRFFMLALFWLFSDFFAKRQVVINCLMKFFFDLFTTCTFKVYKIIDPFNFAVQHSIIWIVVDSQILAIPMQKCEIFGQYQKILQ